MLPIFCLHHVAGAGADLLAQVAAMLLSASNTITCDDVAGAVLEVTSNSSSGGNQNNQAATHAQVGSFQWRQLVQGAP